MMKYLLDSSAIVNLVKAGKLKVFLESSTLSLAPYECLNAIWKEHMLLRRIDLDVTVRLAKVLAKVFRVLNVMTIEGAEDDVLRFAIENKITVYDASYVKAAEKEKLVLVSDDERLIRIASKYVKTLRSKDLV